MKKILVANRGEIALRIIQTIREMGYTAVAVYSPVDRNSLHVSAAHEAYSLGDSSVPKDSYLNQDKLVHIALDSGAHAVHPGYGFLSENGSFAQKVEEAGLVFVGPRPESIDLLGNKINAKQAARKAEVPVLEGTQNPVANPEEGREAAEKIGFPVLIKAAAGGGGRGMRVVRESKEFADSFQRAQSEAEKAFGDGSVFIEKYVDKPRHIEVQIVGDGHGNVLHFGERECSIQRRHQKMIEEAPAAVLPQEVREQIQEAAVRIGKTLHYRNAGTVEFLVDKDSNFFFLEINTRLQVEHPATEMITGVDLVREMLHVAFFQELSMKQDDIHLQGHAIELRINGEDAAANFLPVEGQVRGLQIPRGPFVRFDSLLFDGFELFLYYDSLLAKLIAWDRTREQAIAKLQRALDELILNGFETNIPFLKLVLADEAYRKGDISTNYIDKNLEGFLATLAKAPPEEIMEFLAVQWDEGQQPLVNERFRHWSA